MQSSETQYDTEKKLTQTLQRDRKILTLVLIVGILFLLTYSVCIGYLIVTLNSHPLQ
jgi:hypothetical protein